jgi:glycogen debranching enzyme
VEWKYYLLTGDKSRFSRVLPVLDRYFNWIDKNCRGAGKAAGLFYNTHLGSGMDNSPREGIEQGGWIDLSAQMALFAKYLMFISRELPDEALSKVYEQRYRLLSRLINSHLWNEADGFYYDLGPDGRKIPVKTAAAFWTMVAEVTTFPQAQKLAGHLQNPAEFYRSHLFPTLSADDKNYDGNGSYWRGGVWAPVNYMIIKGLDMFPLRELAAVAAMNHIKNIYEVYQNFQPDVNRIAPEERDGQYQTIWECYSPDNIQPATRWDGQFYSRQDFVGWSGLGPIALLLENVIGLQPSAPEDKLYWNLRMREAHGVENYRFGDNQVDIFCESNELPVGPAVVQINSSSPFTLYISSQIGMQEYQVKSGENRFTIQL